MEITFEYTDGFAIALVDGVEVVRIEMAGKTPEYAEAILRAHFPPPVVDGEVPE